MLLLLSTEERWKFKLNQCCAYIKKNNKQPSYLEKTLYSWIKDQKSNYNNNTGMLKKQKCRTLWKSFIKKHKII